MIGDDLLRGRFEKIDAFGAQVKKFPVAVGPAPDLNQAAGDVGRHGSEQVLGRLALTDLPGQFSVPDDDDADDQPQRRRGGAADFNDRPPVDSFLELNVEPAIVNLGLLFRR